MSRGKKPQKAAMREMMHNYLRQNEIGIKNGTSILDTGCGSGRDAKGFFALGYHVTALDVSAKMYEATKKS